MRKYLKEIIFTVVIAALVAFLVYDEMRFQNKPMPPDPSMTLLCSTNGFAVGQKFFDGSFAISPWSEGVHKYRRDAVRKAWRAYDYHERHKNDLQEPTAQSLGLHECGEQ